MAILGECPECHKKQSARNKKCSCGVDLEKAKKSRKVRYWINFRKPDGTQCRQAVGSFEGMDPYSIEHARVADSKKRVLKKENRLLDIKPEYKMTFNDLKDWYLKLERVKSLKYYPTIEIFLDKFNSEFGNTIVSDLKPVDLENLQVKRKKEGKADSTVDEEITIARTMINKAFDNDLIGGDTLKVFKKVKRPSNGTQTQGRRFYPWINSTVSWGTCPCMPGVLWPRLSIPV